MRLIALLCLCSTAALFGNLRGLVLLGNEECLLNREELAEVQGLRLWSIDLPGSSSQLASKLDPLYLEKEWNVKTILALKKAIYDYYQANHHPFIVIDVPPGQNRSSDVLQLVVHESRLGKVQVDGNRWTASKQLERYLKIQPGDLISTRELSRDVNFMNRNPFRSVNVIYSPGQAENTTDLVLEVHDRRQYRFYTGFDNTGVLVTGRQRVFAGFSWDQIFGLDHVFSYQYTTNYNGSRFHANTFQYLALLPYQAVLNLYGGFSLVHADISSPNKENKGTNIQASIRYQTPLIPYTFYSHEVGVGFDIKNTNNTMQFVDLSPTFGQTVNLTQFLLGYRAKWEKEALSIDGALEVVFSPMKWLPGQTNEDFNSLRPSAKNKWCYVTASCKIRGPFLSLPSYSYEFFVQTQLSSQVLLPSEQLSIGGHSSVRGYDERQFNADSGLVANLEVHFPSFSVIRRKTPNPDRLYFLVFLDAGYGTNKVAVPDIKPTEFLIGIGPGLRYAWGPYLTARCDWGIKLHQEASFTGGGSMIHFSVIGSF
jgi:hemolysin activation/secretion protein